MEKLQDLCDGKSNETVAMRCYGYKDGAIRCTCTNRNGCSFFRVPTTSVDDMCIYVSRMRDCRCEIPIDTVMDHLEGI